LDQKTLGPSWWASNPGSTELSETWRSAVSPTASAVNTWSGYLLRRATASHPQRMSETMPDAEGMPDEATIVTGASASTVAGAV